MLVGNAHIALGGRSLVPRVLEWLAAEGVDTQANPDLFVRAYGSFGIDEARELAARSAMRALGGGRRYFVIAIDTMTLEAQNALLKTLEEPPADAVFVFVHPSPQTLLPTLRSRVTVQSMAGVAAESTIDCVEFLRAGSQKRLDMVKALLEKGEGEQRDLGSILSFLSALERELGKRMSGNGGPIGGLHAVYRARRYTLDRGALVKPLLEQVALLV